MLYMLALLRELLPAMGRAQTKVCNKLIVKLKICTETVPKLSSPDFVLFPTAFFLGWDLGQYDPESDLSA